MIVRERRGGPYVIQCDTCGETEELEGSDFHDAVKDAKERGFVVRKKDHTWKHYCQDCKDGKDA